jgi:hypothetical protein
VVAAIAAIELPNNDWQDLITSLLGAINSGDVNTRVATLQCIGYICETIVRGQHLHFDYLTDPPYPSVTRHLEAPVKRNSYCGGPRRS